jgi:hypothetical protein
MIKRVETSAIYLKIDDVHESDWKKFKKLTLELDEGGIAFFLGDLKKAGMEVLIYSEGMPVEVDAAFEVHGYNPITGALYIHKDVLLGIFDETYTEIMKEEGWEWPEPLVTLYRWLEQEGEV